MRNCLTEDDIMGYTRNEHQSAQERDGIQEHLRVCGNCEDRVMTDAVQVRAAARHRSSREVRQVSHGTVRW